MTFKHSTKMLTTFGPVRLVTTFFVNISGKKFAAY